MAELLKAPGYATGGFGKWGSAIPAPPACPKSRASMSSTAITTRHTRTTISRVSGAKQPGRAHARRQRRPGKPGKGDAYTPDLISAETFKFIEANKDRPFFCYVAWTLPHGNFEIPDASAFADRPWPQPVKNHAAMIARLDTDIGRVNEETQGPRPG